MTESPSVTKQYNKIKHHGNKRHRLMDLRKQRKNELFLISKRKEENVNNNFKISKRKIFKTADNKKTSPWDRIPTTAMNYMK